MLSSFMKQASGDTAPIGNRANVLDGTKYDAVTASRSILSSYLSIASETGGSKKPAADYSRGGEKTAGHNSFSRGSGAGWRNFVGAFDDDEFVNTAPVAGAANVRKSVPVVGHSNRDTSSPASVQSFRMPEPLYSPVTPTSDQPLRLHLGELDDMSSTKPLSASIGVFRGSIQAADSKRVAFEPLRLQLPPQDSAIVMATEQLQDQVQQLTKRCEDTEGAMRGLIQAHADEISLIRAESDMLTSENSRLRVEVAELQRSNGELADDGVALRRMNEGLQLQLAESANTAKSRDAVAADTRSQLEHVYRGRIDLLQREVSELNAKLIAAASRASSDDSAAEWAPYFQAAQRDHEQKIQELHATHAADMRLLQEAKERERALWEKEIDAALAHVKMQEEKRRNDSAIAEEKLKLILESQAKEAKQLRDVHESQMAASAARATESLKRADALQCSVNELQSKCKDLESQLHAAKQSTEDANLKAAERELQAKLQAEAEASHMYRQLKSEHAADVQALLVQVNDASAASAADRTSHASVLQELRSCQAAHAAALSEKDRVIASKQSEISEAEARFHSYKKHAEEESAAAASSHAQAYRTQEAAHAASVEALQATYEMQLRQMRATSQGAIESVGKSQDALTSVLDSRLADLQRHHREEMAQVIGSHNRQIQQLQRNLEAQEQAHVLQMEELKREMVADVGMLQATHMQEMSVAHERALASAATASAANTQPPDLEPKVSIHLISSSLVRIKHSCALARASCRVASDGMRSLVKEVTSGFACAGDAVCLMQQQWIQEQQHWKQRRDVQISGHILAESVELIQQQHHNHLLQQQDALQQSYRHQESQNFNHQHQQDHMHAQQHHSAHSNRLTREPRHASPLSDATQTGSSASSTHLNSRHVRFMLADGEHEPGVSPGAPPSALPQSSSAQVTDFSSSEGSNRAAVEKRKQQEEDSLDEGYQSDGTRSLQSYLHDGRSEDRSDDSIDGIKIATLWPPHQHSPLPPASAATLNLMMQNHSPATIAQQLISQARGSSASAPHGKTPPGDPFRNGASLFASQSAPKASSEHLRDGPEGHDAELRARELYGDYVWIVQATQSTDDVGISIQADEKAEREWSSGGDSEQLLGADAATSLLVSSSSDGDMLLQPRMTQLLATLVPAMFEAWNKAEISYVHRKATCCALLSMTSSEKISRMEAEVRAACDVVQKASTELECMRAREALKRRCAILNTRIESLQATFTSLDARALTERANVTATIKSLAKQRTAAASEKKRLTSLLSLMAPNWQLKHQRPLTYRGMEYMKILQRDKRCEDSLAANKMLNSIKTRTKRAF